MVFEHIEVQESQFVMCSDPRLCIQLRNVCVVEGRERAPNHAKEVQKNRNGHQQTARRLIYTTDFTCRGGLMAGEAWHYLAAL